MAGSALDQVETDEEYEELLAARDRRADAEPLQQTVAARYWRRHARELGLLVGVGDAGTFVVGVGMAAGGKRARRRGVAAILIGPWRQFGQPIAMETLLETVSERSASTLRRIFDSDEARPLPPIAGADLLTALRQSIDGFDDLVDSVLPEQSVVRGSSMSVERLDANLTALRLFSRAWRGLQVVESSGPSDFAVEIELASTGNENDYITDDTSSFLDWDRSRGSRQGWFEFRSGDRRLNVKNLNVSTAENETGADLVYVSREPDVIVLVQYKLLEILQTTGDAVFRPDGRLDGQVQRLLALSPSTIDRGSAEEASRLGPDFGFVKFIVPSEPRQLRGDDLPHGKYYPADAVRRMLSHPDQGPHGGRVYYVERRRSIDGETFARLVRDRWIGSSGTATDILLRTLGVRPSAERAPLTLAVDEPLI